MNTFFQTTQQYLAALNQRPEISMAYSTFDVRYPQWTVEVDASKCKRAGITPDQVLSTPVSYTHLVIQVEGGFLTQGNLLGQGNDLIVGCCFYSA